MNDTGKNAVNSNGDVEMKSEDDDSDDDGPLEPLPVPKVRNKFFFDYFYILFVIRSLSIFGIYRTCIRIQLSMIMKPNFASKIYDR